MFHPESSLRVTGSRPGFHERVGQGSKRQELCCGFVGQPVCAAAVSPGRLRNRVPRRGAGSTMASTFASQERNSPCIVSGCPYCAGLPSLQILKDHRGLHSDRTLTTFLGSKHTLPLTPSYHLPNPESCYSALGVLEIFMGLYLALTRQQDPGDAAAFYTGLLPKFRPHTHPSAGFRISFLSSPAHSHWVPVLPSPLQLLECQRQDAGILLPNIHLPIQDLTSSYNIPEPPQDNL